MRSQTEFSEQDRCLRADEVAGRLAIARATAYSLMASGVLPTVRIGRSVRVPAAALDRWIADNSMTPVASSQK